jgi:hypothetical protein
MHIFLNPYQFHPYMKNSASMFHALDAPECTTWPTAPTGCIDWPKWNIPELQKVEIKYGFEDLKSMNIFVPRNFFRFEMDFKWKFREISMFRIW